MSNNCHVPEGRSQVVPGRAMRRGQTTNGVPRVPAAGHGGITPRRSFKLMRIPVRFVPADSEVSWSITPEIRSSAATTPQAATPPGPFVHPGDRPARIEPWLRADGGAAPNVF